MNKLSDPILLPFEVFPDKAYYCLNAWRSKNNIIHKVGRSLLRVLGCELPRGVKLGKDFVLKHNGMGIVIEQGTQIGNRVTIFQQVTIGWSDVYLWPVVPDFQVIVEDDVILGAGAKVLAKKGTLRIGTGTIVGANSVLLQSTGEFEVWAGIPAKKIATRPPLNYRT